MKNSPGARVPFARQVAGSLVIVAGLLAAGATSPAGAVRIRAANALNEPPALHSVNGVLETKLVLDEGPAQFGDRIIDNVWSYHVDDAAIGTYPGPTLYVNRGDTVRIQYVNNLAQSTNLHTHGLHVSPTGNSDNVLLEIPSGSENHYEFKIPENQPDGLYWYHPHNHGTTSDQVYHGLVGFIVVGRPDSGPRELDGVAQRLLALQYSNLGPGGTTLVPPPPPGRPTAETQYTVNGQVNPQIDIRPGELQVWNVGNFSNNGSSLLTLRGKDGTTDQPFWIVAQDGQPYPAPVRYEPGAGLLMAAGMRYSILVQGPAAGTYELVTDPYNDGFSEWPRVALATVVSAGEPVVGASIPERLTPPVNPFRALDREEVDYRRTADFNLFPVATGGVDFRINGEVFPNNPVFQSRLNTVEEWEITNSSADDHPFHIHVNSFQVISQDNPANPSRNITSPQPWYQDVIDLPAAKTNADGTVTPSRTVIRMKTEDFTGAYVYHCHRVDHEDRGMMALFAVLPETPIYAVAGSSANSARVAVFSGVDNRKVAEVLPFGARYRGTVSVAVGDVNNDSVQDLIVGAGPGGGPRVRVLNGKNKFRKELLSFNAFTGFKGGVSVAAADLDGDGHDDIITGAGPGASPTVRVFSGADGDQIGEFLAYDAAFRGGVNVAAGLIQAGGRFSIITGPAQDGPPVVKVFDVDWHGTEAHGGPHAAHSAVTITETASVIAFDPTFQGGVNVGAGSIQGQNGGYSSVLAAPARNAEPLVKSYVLSGGHGHAGNLGPAVLTAGPSFLADTARFRGGVSVSAISTETGADLLVAPESRGRSVVRRLKYDATAGQFSIVKQLRAFGPAFNRGHGLSGK